MEGEKRVIIDYDKRADVLYIILKRGKGVAEEILDGIFARYDHKTGELLGLTIVGASKLLGKGMRVEVPSFK